MVQQTIDSKFSEYGLANSETGLPKHDKQLPVLLAAKKTALRDLQNENRNMVPKSVGSSLFLKESAPSIEAVKVSGTKRPQPECLVRSTRHQTPTTNVNGHLVYVRRKAESELRKSSTCDKTSNDAGHPQSRELGDQAERIHQQSPLKDSTICIPEAVPVPESSSHDFSSAKPPVPLASGKSNITSPIPDPNCLQVTSATPSLDYPKRLSDHLQHWEERYFRLQSLLKVLDQSNQDDYLQMLRSLSSLDLSRLAVELEKRTIQLSLEEAKEVQRVWLMDVLGKYPRNNGAPTTQPDPSQK